MGGQKYPENTIKKAIIALVAPNGWISMDLGWIWAGYIQGGLLVPFGPTKIAPGGLQGGQKWPKNAIKCALGISRQAKMS